MNELAASLAGHDKGHIYVIVRREEEMVYLADGRLKTLDKPKKKNRRHIRKITGLSGQVLQSLGDVRQDSDLVHALRLYHQSRKTAQD